MAGRSGRSTPLHIAAISNRVQCSVAILQYFVSAFSLLSGLREEEGQRLQCAFAILQYFVSDDVKG